MDNLESVTYEVFEKDPVKYTEYQRVSISLPNRLSFLFIQVNFTEIDFQGLWPSVRNLDS